MAKEKFNYRPVYYISAALALLMVAAMFIPDPFVDPATGAVEQRNLSVFFKADVAETAQRKVIKEAGATVYRNDKPGEYEIVLDAKRPLKEAVEFLEQHDTVARVATNSSAVEQRNLMVFFKQGVNEARQKEIIKAADGVVYRVGKAGEYEIFLNPNQALETAFDFLDQHEDVARVSKAEGSGLLHHKIMLRRDMTVEVKR